MGHKRSIYYEVYGLSEYVSENVNITMNQYECVCKFKCKSNEKYKYEN